MGNGGRGGFENVRSVVAEKMPDYRVDSVVQLGEGWDNVTYEVNGEVIVRFSKESDPGERAVLVNREARLLAAVAGISPLPVPEPRFTAAEQGCLAYVKVPGARLLDMPRPQRPAHLASIAATLGELLTAIHAVPADQMTDLVHTYDHPPAQWRNEAAKIYPSVAGKVPAVHNRRIEAFLNAPPPNDEYVLTFCHNDLGIEHILVDPVEWTVTGVIDWGDAALADPAYDFGLLFRDLGPAATDDALHSYRTEVNDVGTLRVRAEFYARCSVFEDMAYGIETGRDRYVAESLAALEWLFPA